MTETVGKIASKVRHLDIQVVRDCLSAFRQRRKVAPIYDNALGAAVDAYMAAHSDLPDDWENRLEASAAVMRMLCWGFEHHAEWMSAARTPGEPAPAMLRDKGGLPGPDGQRA